MKKRVLCCTLLFIFSLSSYSQTTKNCKSVHALPIIEKGIKLVDSTKFDEAVTLFTSVPIGDSLYARAQYELAYAYSNMQKYEEAVKICQYLINHPDQYINSSWVETLLANSYSDLNNFEKALEIYDLGIQKYPYSNQLHFNKGIVFMKMKDYDQAIACFEKAVFCRPAHQGSHYRLGLAYLQKGYTIPGILALNYAALLRPNSEYAINALQTIDAIYAEGINTYNADILISDETVEKNAKYKKIMTLIQANFALNKQYKIKSNINHILAKQNQLLFEMIEPTDSYELIDRLYIPYFKSVLQDNSYNTFSYFLMSGTDIENGKVKEKAIKMQKEILTFVDKMKKNLDETIAKGICIDNKEQYTYFYDNNYNLSAFGKIEVDGKGNKNRNGQWCYLKSSGALSEIGNFADHQQHGLFTIYDGMGHVMQEVPWRNGKIEGLGKTYHTEQTSHEKLLEMEIEYVDGKPNGSKKIYNRSGILTEDAILQNGYYEGEVKTYNDHGGLIEATSYTKGVNYGKSYLYYDNGVMSNYIFYSGQDERGDLFFYYPNGEIRGEGFVMNGNRNGKWKNYFFDGKLYKESEYNNKGEEMGNTIFYNQNGSKNSEFNFINGKKEGEELYYSLNGILTAKFLYKNDLLTDIYLYNTDGSEKNHVLPKNKIFVFDMENEGRLKRISCNNKGEKEGINYTYHENGRIAEAICYKNDEIDGKYSDFYLSGAPYSISEYKQGKLNGLSVQYHPNGELESEGYYILGTPYGAHYNYFIDGKLDHITIYNEGKTARISSYFPNGNLRMDSQYKNGILFSSAYYNEKGNLFKTDTFTNGNGVRNRYYLNGNLLSTVNMIAGNYKDTIIWYKFDGSVLCKEFFYNDKIQGNYFTYSTFYQPKNVAQMLLGEYNGMAVNYFENGNILTETPYQNGSMEGNVKNYYFNGNLHTNIPCMNNTYHGTAHFYAPDGKTMMYQLQYNGGRIVSYSYREQNNKMTEFIPFDDKKIEIVAYYPNGKKTLELIFDKGAREGKELVYYENGKIFEENHYLNGYYHGQVQVFYPNGNLQLKGNYYYGDYDGKIEEYNENGTLFLEKNYDKGLLHGEAKKYDKNGKLTHAEFYFYGNLLNENSY